MFRASNHIFGHYRTNGKPYFEKWKIRKIAKKSILAQNSNSSRVADIGRDGDIWPEMGLWGVLEGFCTKNQYLNPSKSFLATFWKIVFLKFLFVGFGHFEGGRIFYGSGIGQKMAGTCLFDSCLFPKKMTTIRSGYFRNAIRICILVPISQNGHISHLSELLN